MSKKIILYLPEHWKRTTKKQKEAQAERDAFADMVHELIAQGFDEEGDRATEEAQALVRLSKLLITDD